MCPSSTNIAPQIPGLGGHSCVGGAQSAKMESPPTLQKIIQFTRESPEIIYAIRVSSKNNLKAKYIKTPKNEQVKEFFDRCSFGLIDEDDHVRYYILPIKRYVPKNINYIKVINGK